MKPAQKAWAEFGWQVLGALLVAAAIGGLYARGESTRDLSPCAENPRGGKCADQREAVARAEPLRNPCIQSQRVTGERGRNCPRFFVDTDAGKRTEREGQAPESVRTAGGGEAQKPPQKGTQQPGPRGDGGDQGGDEGGQAPDGPKPNAADPPPAAGPSGDPPKADPPRADPPAAAGSPPGLIEQTTGAAAGVVDQAGKDVQQTVDNATCNPLVSLCSK